MHLRDLPFVSRADVLAPGIFPRWFRETEDAIRDAIADALLVTFAKFASLHAARNAETDERYATGANLDLLGASRDMPRALGESDDAYRARQLSDQDAANPRAILAAIDRITARLTTKQAYYYERPKDEAFVHGKASAIGFYPGAKFHPVRKVNRAYAQRGRCEPRHVHLWRSRRSALGGTPTVPVPVAPAAFLVKSYDSDDSTAPNNGHGHVILGLPAFLRPGAAKASDAFVFSKATPPLVDASGVTTPAAATRGRLASSVFAKATIATRAAAGLSTGASVFRRLDTAESIVAEIRALLAARASFGAVTTLFFDPTL